jgi:2-dehydropantoate 2-reductase
MGAMRWSVLIVGTGAMACLFAARLAAVKVLVAMLGTWSEGLNTIRERGVCLVRQDGAETVYPVAAFSEKGANFSVDRALVLVKSWQTERAAHQLENILSPDGIALTLQNGLGNREILADTLGSSRVALGVTTTGATLLGPGRVRPGGEGIISLENHPSIGDYTNIFMNAGFAVEATKEVDSLLWGKLVVNSAINPLSALLRVSNGELLSSTHARMLMAVVAKETAAVAQASGIKLPFNDPVQAVIEVVRRTALNRSSMFQDILRGAPTEIDAICGAIVKAGEAVEVPTPVNQAMWLLLKAAAGSGNQESDQRL